MSTEDRDLSSLERQITVVLRVGLQASASVLALGLVIVLIGPPAGARVIEVGLVLLMSVPVIRIGASFIDARRRRDRLLTWATAIVLAVMALTLAISLGRG